MGTPFEAEVAFMVHLTGYRMITINQPSFAQEILLISNIRAQFSTNSIETNQSFLITTEAVLDKYTVSEDWEWPNFHELKSHQCHPVDLPEGQ